MNFPGVPEFRPGRRINPADLNKMARGLTAGDQASAAMFGRIGIDRTNGGVAIRDGDTPKHWARITARGAGSSNNAYSHNEVIPDGSGGWTDITPPNGHHGTYSTVPAREWRGRTDVPVDGSAVVELSLDPVGLGWVFEWNGNPCNTGIFYSTTRTYPPFCLGGVLYTQWQTETWIRNSAGCMTVLLGPLQTTQAGCCDCNSGSTDPACDCIAEICTGLDYVCVTIGELPEWSPYGCDDRLRFLENRTYRLDRSPTDNCKFVFYEEFQAADPDGTPVTVCPGDTMDWRQRLEFYYVPGVCFRLNVGVGWGFGPLLTGIGATVDFQPADISDCAIQASSTRWSAFRETGSSTDGPTPGTAVEIDLTSCVSGSGTGSSTTTGTGTTAGGDWWCVEVTAVTTGSCKTVGERYCYYCPSCSIGSTGSSAVIPACVWEWIVVDGPFLNAATCTVTGCDAPRHL